MEHDFAGEYRLLPLAVFFMGVFGFAFVLFFVNTNTMIQLEVPDNYRGRVMSLFTLTFLGLDSAGCPADRRAGKCHRNARDADRDGLDQRRAGAGDSAALASSLGRGLKFCLAN